MTPKNFKLKAIDPNVVHHPIEKRGFVTVPFDYQNPRSDTIQIFYRLIPAEGRSPEDPEHPVLVVINGGPGISSRVYRNLDFDYTDPDHPKNGKLNRFKYYSKTHRVLIVDQRGTDGFSAPLEVHDPNLDPIAVAKYFSSDYQARDYLAVIQKVVPQEQPFWMIAQSYGGMVGMQYLSLPEARIPKGIVFSCSALPYEDMLESSLQRRQEQLKLNLRLLECFPQIKEKIMKVREHLSSLELDPNFILSLFSSLGRDVERVWEQQFVAELDQMLNRNRDALVEQFKNSSGGGDVLNYILSSANFTPGFTDRTIAMQTNKAISFEPWMIDENWIMMQIGAEDAVTRKIILEMDQNPPLPTPFPTLNHLRSCISQNQLLFTSADNDAFVPFESYVKSYKKFLVPGHTQSRHLPGGHHAIFLQEGHRQFMDWSRTLR